VQHELDADERQHCGETVTEVDERAQRTLEDEVQRA
jgi:hypothetical protein